MKEMIRSAVTPDGTALHLVPISPDRLPRIQKRDLEQAWEDAHRAARAGEDGPQRGFRFAGGPDVLLQDRDARAWAASVDRTADLSTAHGVSVCLRLVGLIALIAEARWIAPFVRIGRGGVALDGELLNAASLTKLTKSGNLDATAIRALLRGGANQEISSCPG